ncbi:MAG: hypothetical protein V5A47_13995 [Bacteroidales bacterium]
MSTRLQPGGKEHPDNYTHSPLQRALGMHHHTNLRGSILTTNKDLPG